MTSQQIERYVRFTDGSHTAYGFVEGDMVYELVGDYFGEREWSGRQFSLDDVKLDLPLDPRRVQKVIGVTYNYNAAGESKVVPHPAWFCKLSSALNPHDHHIELPPYAKNLNYEGELVIVIGREGRNISIDDAPSHIFGVTIGNDVSENTWFFERQGLSEPSRLVAKSNDTWACLYTTIVRGLDYSDLHLQVRLNGDIVTDGRTSSMVNNPARLISYLSNFVTLQPGDLIYTGTASPPCLPGMRHAMQDGDVVEVEIEQIGTLRNHVVAVSDDGRYEPVRFAEDATAAR